MPIRVSDALVAATLLLTAPAPLLRAQEADSPRLTVDRIYGSRDFRSERFGPVRWLGDGTSYTTLERREDGPGRDIVRYDTETAARAVFVPAGELIPARDTIPLAIRNYAWSDEFERLLIFTNSKRVWRTNTRGDYWVLDRASGQLQQLGGSKAPESSLMFAKFSPDGDRVGYVVKNNIYVEETLREPSLSPDLLEIQRNYRRQYKD